MSLLRLSRPGEPTRYIYLDPAVARSSRIAGEMVRADPSVKPKRDTSEASRRYREARKAAK